MPDSIYKKFTNEMMKTTKSKIKYSFIFDNGRSHGADERIETSNRVDLTPNKMWNLTVKLENVSRDTAFEKIYIHLVPTEGVRTSRVIPGQGTSLTGTGKSTKFDILYPQKHLTWRLKVHFSTAVPETQKLFDVTINANPVPSLLFRKSI